MQDDAPVGQTDSTEKANPLTDFVRKPADPTAANDFAESDSSPSGASKGARAGDDLSAGGFSPGDVSPANFANADMSGGNFPDDGVFDSGVAEGELSIADEFDRDGTAEGSEVDEVEDELLLNRIAPMERYTGDACRELKGLTAVLAVLTGGSAEMAALYQHAINRELRRRSAAIQAFEDLMSHIEQSNKVSATAGRFAELLRRLDDEVPVNNDEPRRLMAAKAKNHDFVTP